MTKGRNDTVKMDLLEGISLLDTDPKKSPYISIHDDYNLNYDFHLYKGVTTLPRS